MINIIVIFLFLLNFTIFFVFFKKSGSFIRFIASPIGIFTLFYSLHVLVPFVLIFYFYRYIIGYGIINNNDEYLFVKCFSIFTLFILLVCFGFSTSSISLKLRSSLYIKNFPKFTFAIILLLLGYYAVNQTTNLTVRGDLVKTSNGIFYYVVVHSSLIIAAHLSLLHISCRSSFIGYLLIIPCIFISLTLGGRGFTIILLLSLIFYYSHKKRLSFAPFSILLFSLFIIGVFLDFAIGFLRHGLFFSFKNNDVGIIQSFITQRGFNAVQNFFLVLNDKTFFNSELFNFRNLSNDRFMLHFFPSVFSNGYGFPMGMVAEIFLLGWYPLLLIFGFFFGILLKFFQISFFRSIDPNKIFFICYIVFFLFPVGRNLIDNIEKSLFYIFISFFSYLFVTILCKPKEV